MRELVTVVLLVALVAIGADRAAAQSPNTFEACYVPDVGAIYLIGLTDLPTGCLDDTHVPIGWTDGGAGGTVTSVQAGTGLLGGEITTSGTLSVDFAGPGTAGTVARSDHTHAVGAGLNTVVGAAALLANTTGTGNTALGLGALRDNTSNDNTAVGAGALNVNVMGIQNTAVGSGALIAATDGLSNTVVGFDAMGESTGGSRNVAVGTRALRRNSSIGNVAIGEDALTQSTSGDDNVAIGRRAGFNLADGDDNVYIASPGLQNESNTIRIGGIPHTAAFISGISGATVTTAQVFVNAAGQLGTATSTIRAKEEIEALGDRSRRVLELEPVQFRYRPEYDDGSRLIQYGLIAEEVAATFPELASYDPDGAVRTVRYHLLPVLLLNELQRQERRLERQERELAELREAVRAQAAALDELRSTSRAAGR